MSGLEVAGLVLGAVPIALKSYGELSTCFKNYRRFELQSFKLRQKYANQADLFKVSVRRLFTHWLSKETVSGILKDPEHQSWFDEDTKQKLGTALDNELDLCDAIKRNVGLINRTLDEVLLTLRTVGLEKESNSKDKHNGFHTYAFHRSKWALYKKSKIEALLDEVGAANRDLENFVQAIVRERKHTQQPRRPSQPTIEDTKDIRDGYSKIYVALSTAWARCGCTAHDVELALQYGKDEDSMRSLRQPPPECRVIFHAGSFSSCWYTLPTQGRQEPPQTDTPLTGNVKESSSSKNQPTQSNGLATSTTLKQCTPPISNPQQRIDDICSSLQALGWSAQVVHECNQQFHDQRSSSPGPYSAHVFSCESHFDGISLSLAQVLRDNSANSHLTRLLRYPYQCLRLAYILSLSLLRLYSSPWLGEQQRWTSERIRFMTMQSSDATPYLTAAAEATTNMSVSNRVRNYQIYSLGVIMLELAGCKLSTSTAPAQYDHDQELSELLAVLELDKINEASRVFGQRYGKIVSRCIWFDFGVDKQDLKEVALQEAFYRLVVCELESCLKSLSGVPGT